MINQQFLPEPRTDLSIEFLTALLPLRWDLAAIPPDGGHPEFQTFAPSESEQAYTWIEERQGISGLYYQVNLVRSGLRNRKATKADIDSVLNLHADIDLDDAAALKRIQSFSPPPSIIVFSGGGFQPIWALQEPSTKFERAEQINKAIAQRLGGDHCHNIDRLLRLPGTINMPNAKKRASGRVPTLARVIQ